MKRKTLYNLIMVAVIVAIIGGGLFGVGYIRGWFDGTDGPMLKDRMGVVRIQRNGVNFEVEQDTALRNGDIIMTQTGATAVIYLQGSTITMGGEGKLIVEDVEKGHLRLTAGEVFANAEEKIYLTFETESGQMAVDAQVFLAAERQEENVTEINLVISNATVAVSYRSGAQTVSVFRGQLDDVSAGQTKEYVGGGTFISDIQIESLNTFLLNQIRKTNENVTLCVSNAELDDLEEKRRQEIEDIINGTTEPDEPVHEHSYGVSIVGATCTTGGYTLHSCACGDSYRDNETAMKGHSYGPWTTIKAATESEEGLMERKCQNCDVSEEKTVGKLNHVHVYEEEVIEPTCTTKGYTQYTCACGHSYVDKETEATGHSYAETVVAPTCTSKGYTKYTCACGDSYIGDEKEATGHRWGEWETLTAATEESEGLMKRACENCSVEEEKIIEKLTHVHNYSIEVVAATCTTGGYTLHSCACGDSYRDNETAMKGHSYGPWTTIKAATESEEGLMERKCQNCDATEEKTVGKLNHVHVYEEEVIEPTCTTKGYTQYTCACGHSYVDNETEATGHGYAETVVAPTCTSKGYTKYTCACGDSYIGDEKEATGHRWGEWETLTPATEESEGLMKRACENCSVEEEKIIEKLTHVHNYSIEVVAATCTTGGYTLHSCACGDSYRDNETAMKGHSYGPWTTIKAATESEEGLMERKCQNCDVSEEKTVGKLNHVHVYEEEVIEPTCTTKGYTQYTCACGHSYVDKETEATGHSYAETVVAPTCTSKGYTKYTCACGESYIGDEKEATGHRWGEWEITKEATAEEAGEKCRTCAACKKKETATIPVPDDGNYVYITIVCNTILDNWDELNPAKAEFVPADGVILPMVKVKFDEGETVFEVLTRICDQTNIQIEYSWTPLYGSYYIEGINNLYEFDCSSESGWMYKVNGWFPNYGCSSYYLEGGEVIVWCYTCHGWGTDVGAPEWTGEAE